MTDTVERAALFQKLRNSIGIRINDLLCETKEGFDDSLVGINEAWDVVRKALDDYAPKFAALASLAAESAAEDNTSKYDNEMFNEGVTHAVELLAKSIGATGWYAGDGSEDYDCDLAQTFLNILAAKGLYDEDDGRFATLASAKSVPDGWQLVPTKLTKEIGAVMKECEDGKRSLKEAWAAMLAAAPTPPATGENENG